MGRKKFTIHKLHKMKRDGEKFAMLTAYDTPTARMLDESGVEILLVGDSCGNVVLGYPDTIPVTMEQILHHTAAVTRGTKYAFVVGDMPFMSYQVSVEEAVTNAGRFVKESRADGIKLEGGAVVADRLKAIVDAGIPACGHLGLTPQSVTMLGGYKIQGRTAEQAQVLVDDALRLEDAGAFMILLELIPAKVGKFISEKLTIPTVGIGAGPDCDGQILIVHDMLGIQAGFSPTFVKVYAEIEKAIKGAAANFVSDVKERAFPAEEHCFDMDEEEFKKLK